MTERNHLHLKVIPFSYQSSFHTADCSVEKKKKFSPGSFGRTSVGNRSSEQAFYNFIFSEEVTNMSTFLQFAVAAFLVMWSYIQLMN